MKFYCKNPRGEGCPAIRILGNCQVRIKLSKKITIGPTFDNPVEFEFSWTFCEYNLMKVFQCVGLIEMKRPKFEGSNIDIIIGSIGSIQLRFKS